MWTALDLLQQAVSAFASNCGHTTLGNHAAVQALASGLTTVIKRSAAFIVAAGTTQSATATAAINSAGAVGGAAATVAEKAVQNFPAMLPLVSMMLFRTAHWLEIAMSSSYTLECLFSATGSSDDSIFTQVDIGGLCGGRVRVSAALLCVVIARSLVLLADAQATAAAAASTTQEQLFARSVMARPKLRIQWALRSAGYITAHVQPQDDVRFRSVPGQWYRWQVGLLVAFRCLYATMVRLGLAGLEDSGYALLNSTSGRSSGSSGVPMASPSTTQQANSSTSSTTDSSSTGNTSSSSDARCSYLLRLHSSSQLWAGAVAGFNGKWPNVCSLISTIVADRDTPEVAAAMLPLLAGGGEQAFTAAGVQQDSASWLAASTKQRQCVSQLYTDALSLCRTLAAAAPLPLLCNNPGCTNLSGVSEAAAAAKVCAGCHCRYCSAECQAADWRRHKRACRRMAALGDRCSWLVK